MPKWIVVIHQSGYCHQASCTYIFASNETRGSKSVGSAARGVDHPGQHVPAIHSCTRSPKRLPPSRFPPRRPSRTRANSTSRRRNSHPSTFPKSVYSSHLRK
ncbi:hypothetical protein PUN28_010162 [Cardiocondyla obscurior]|uniref:Uncharacterized protein n=1 Tax=Cardiocondyla obscurior TaxID=286306 RepID=A0AAW2FPS4_9HYME